MAQELPVQSEGDRQPPATAARDLGGDPRWELVTRVVTSRHFSKAGQLRELLLYTARKAITEPGSEISEQDIGAHALGRRPDYDPQEDTIVRVQMRHLRERLEKYYADEGAAESILLTVPKGSYVPRFEARVTEDAVPEEPTRPYRTWAWCAAGILLALMAFAAGRFTAGAPKLAPEQAEAAGPLWSKLFSKDQPTNIVIADSSLVVVQDLLNLDLTLDEYLARAYRKQIEEVGDTQLRSALSRIASRQYTSMADAVMASKLSVLGRRSGARIAVRYARHLNIRDFNNGNFILVGSRRGIPWVRLFERHLDFHLQMDGARVGFKNLHPAAGESSEYWSTPVDGPYETFATLTLLSNLSGTGHVLLLNGTTMEASEAAGEFALRNDFASMVAKRIGVDEGAPLPPFELLLRIGAIAGAPSRVEVIAWRRPKP